MQEESKLIREQFPRSQSREHSVPIYLTSSFIFDDAEQSRAIFANEEDGIIYSRYSNPNTSEFIQKICNMEGAEDGLAFSSGMAAVFASFARSEEHTSELQSLMRISYAVFCLKKK